MHSIQLISNIKRRNEQILDRLDIKTAAKFSDLYTAALNMDILLLYFSGYRGLDKQNELYQKYLRGEGVLAAKPGYSWHNYGRAVDLVPVKETGENAWESQLYPAINVLAQRYGLKWMGWQDSPHFTDSQGQTIRQVREQSKMLITKKKRKNFTIIGISFLALLAGYAGYKLLRK